MNNLKIFIQSPFQNDYWDECWHEIENQTEQAIWDRIEIQIENDIWSNIWEQIKVGGGTHV